MSETEPRTVTREEFNRELVQALDDLVADAHHHGELIRAAFDEPGRSSVARETSPTYGEVPERLDRMEGRLERVDGRLDRIDRTLTEIRDQMRTLATKVELEAMSDRIKLVADGYKTVNQRLDNVADLLKVRVILP